MIAFLDLVRDIDLLPAPSSAVVKFASLAAEGSADLEELASTVRYDALLTQQLLARARATQGERAEGITQVRDALVILGTAGALETAVMHHAARPMMAALPAYGLGEGELWRHGVASSLAVEVIETVISTELPAGTRAAAFLHDVGKIVLARCMDENGLTLGELSQGRPPVFGQAELETLGFSHTMVGARIAQRWTLGPDIVTAIRNHHDPSSAEEPASVGAIRIANLAAKVAGCGLGAEGLGLSIDAAACGRLGITRQDFEFVCAEMHSRLPGALRAAAVLAGVAR